jgi:RNA polymerase sigma-70 factor (ECF subfamily)
VADLAEDVRTALDELPADQRDAISHRIVDGKPYRDVADALGCTEVVARARVSRGLKRIASRLEADAPIELERQRWIRRSTS